MTVFSTTRRQRWRGRVRTAHAQERHQTRLPRSRAASSSNRRIRASTVACTVSRSRRQSTTRCPAIDASYLFSTAFHLISRPGDRLAFRSTVAFRSLQGLPLVGAALPNGGRVLMEEEARRANITLTMAIEVNSVHLMKKPVAAGHGYGVTSPESVASELAQGTLQAARIVSPRLEEHFSLVGSPNRHSSLAVRTIASVARKIGRDLAKMR